jgi:predicted ATP-dependent endonuclease of OLD family
MKLKAIKLENFHGVAGVAEVCVGDFTVLIGRNDVGKSTLLKALDLFLNGATPSSDSNNAKNQGTTVAIELAFSSPARTIVIDDAIQTSFDVEQLLDENGHLRLRREWDTSASRPTPKTFIRRKTFGDEDFLLSTEKELIKKCEKYGIETKKANGEEYNNVEKRQKLRIALTDAVANTNYEWLPLPTSGSSRAKLIHDAAKSLLPPFQYFRADTSLDESDTAIQKYFRSITDNALVAKGMQDIEDQVRIALQGVLSSITTKINQVVAQGDSIEPLIEFDWAKAVTTSFRTTGNQMNVPLAQRGDGFRRITMMAYFEHLAEQDAGEGQQIMFGFEEPETFLHPTAQEQLFEKLESLCEANHQAVLTSHSPIIVARTKSESLIHVTKKDGSTSYLNNVTDLRPLADDLGIRVDNQFVSLFDKAKVLLLVEGIDDAHALEHTATQYKLAGKIPSTFSDLSVVILPIGGCDSIQHWVQLDLLRKLTKPFFIFLDSDKESIAAASPNTAALIEQGFVIGTNCAVTQKRALENYILPAALNRLVPEAQINYTDFDHVKNLCKQHPQAGKLGGKSVAARHFPHLTYDELRLSFCPDGSNDEFLALFQAVTKLVR